MFRIFIVIIKFIFTIVFGAFAFLLACWMCFARVLKNNGNWRSEKNTHTLRTPEVVMKGRKRKKKDKSIIGWSIQYLGNVFEPGYYLDIGLRIENGGYNWHERIGHWNVNIIYALCLCTRNLGWLSWKRTGFFVVRLQAHMMQFCDSQITQFFIFLKSVRDFSAFGPFAAMLSLFSLIFNQICFLSCKWPCACNRI